MISDEGTPKLIDFGLAQVIDDFAEATGYTTSSFATSLRWSAPELLIGVSSLPPKTKKSDVYAAASTCIEVGALQICFHAGFHDSLIDHDAWTSVSGSNGFSGSASRYQWRNPRPTINRGQMVAMR